MLISIYYKGEEISTFTAKRWRLEHVQLY
jgi:hypothetical protein